MNWKFKNSKGVFFDREISESDAILQILAARGICNAESVKEFLEADYEKGTHDPFLFFEMEKIIRRIQEARDKKEEVLIFGDYDADGVTSSAVLVETLNEIGINAQVYIPDKKKEGYGLNILAIEAFRKKNVSLIISVDCGITGINEVNRAKELGMDVIITDHHHVPENLPSAFAILNPKMENSGYPFSDLAGVGVAFKLAQAIFERLIPEKKEHVKWLLDLVAIGTVADCVPLLGENRIFVKYGLLVLSKTKRNGLIQLFSVAKLNIDENNPPSVRNIGYHIAPRINAAGRINHAQLAYDLLIEQDNLKAREFAVELEDNNSSRQKLTEKIVNEVKVIASSKFKDKRVIFAIDEKFPIGVVGLVAGKIAKDFNKPTAVIQKGEKESKGSFRSIPQINIIEIIERCSDLLLKFGGHSQAAGISIENSRISEFEEKLENEVALELKGRDVLPEIEIDLEIDPENVDFSLAMDMERLRPFGQGNPEPILVMRNLFIEEIRSLGNGKNHTKFVLTASKDPTKKFEAIAFFMAKDFAHIEKGEIVDIAFNLQKDEWNGNNRIQCILSDLRLSV